MVNPRISVAQEGDVAFAERALEWLRSVGMELDEWQELVLHASLLEDGDKWAAMDVGLNVARQNGKGEIIIARILVELYLVKSRLTIYSAHNFDTAKEHFVRLVDLIENSEVLSAEVEGRKGSRTWGIYWGRGEQSVVLEGNRRFQIRTRTKGGGRGFSSDLLILDEAMFLSEFFNSALRPIISARPKPQIWTTGSAVDQHVHEDGVVFARVREAAIKQTDPDLTYFEWSAGNGNPEMDNPETFVAMDDLGEWAQANPAMGIRIDPSVIMSERRRLSTRGFAVERLGIGDWPSTDEQIGNPLSLEVWAELEDAMSKLGDEFVVAFDVSPDNRSSISAAGLNGDKLMHVEVIEDNAGTAWVVPMLADLKRTHSPSKIVCDERGPVARLLDACEDAGLEVETFTAAEMAAACGTLVDVVEERNLRHLGDETLLNAIKAAKTRSLGDAWAWSRRNSSANISPLVSCTLALAAAKTSSEREPVMAWA